MPGRGVKASIGGLEREFPPRGGLQAAARASGWLGDSSEAERAALASGTHLPQQVPNPSCRERSRMLVAPQATAVRMCRSETALQTQMIMAPILNANANDCQYRDVGRTQAGPQTEALDARPADA